MYIDILAYLDRGGGGACGSSNFSVRYRFSPCIPFAWVAVPAPLFAPRKCPQYKILRASASTSFVGGGITVKYNCRLIHQRYHIFSIAHFVDPTVPRVFGGGISLKGRCMQCSRVALQRFVHSAFRGPQPPLGGGITLKCSYMPVFLHT